MQFEQSIDCKYENMEYNVNPKTMEKVDTDNSMSWSRIISFGALYYNNKCSRIFHYSFWNNFYRRSVEAILTLQFVHKYYQIFCILCNHLITCFNNFAYSVVRLKI